jgi:hypothetical protein
MGMQALSVLVVMALSMRYLSMTLVLLLCSSGILYCIVGKWLVCAFSVSGSRACCHAFLFCCLFGLVLQTFASHESLKRSGDCRYSMGS